MKYIITFHTRGPYTIAKIQYDDVTKWDADFSTVRRLTQKFVVQKQC